VAQVISRSTRPRIVTASACAPALPDWPGHHRQQHRQRRELRDRALEQADHRRRQEGREQVDLQPGQALAHGEAGADSARSSGLAPTMVSMSRLVSSSTAATSSAWRMTPTNRPPGVDHRQGGDRTALQQLDHVLARVELARRRRRRRA
jgi:hypothetical protein